MITLLIDNQTIQVEPGTTILAAAAKLGITIPTLCFIKPLKPNTTCLVCLVAVEGKTTLVPACSALVEDKMIVQTQTPEVLLAREHALALLLSEHSGDCLAPCHLVCPAQINIPAMIRHIQKNNFNQAWQILSQTTDASNTDLCASCKKPCETVCRRQRHDQPIAIASLVQAVQKHTTQKPLSTKPQYSSTPLNSCSAIRQLTKTELDEFVRHAAQYDRIQPSITDQGFSIDEAIQESLRCLHCDCRKTDTCGLKKYSDTFQIKQTFFKGERIPYQQHIFTHYSFEPSKCIRCGICIQICENANIQSGFTFFQRGFDIRINVPWQDFENKTLHDVLDNCIDHCPTGALCRPD